MEISPELDYKIFSHTDLRLLAEGILKADNLIGTLKEMKNELANKMSIADWMEVIKSCVVDFEMDMDMFMRHNLPIDQYLRVNVLE
jgi:hypothetical protein